MTMIRYSKINYDTKTNKELQEMYIRFKENNSYKSANQFNCLLDYLIKSDRLEDVLKC